MSTWHRIGTEGEPLTDPLTTQAIAALSRGHGLFAGGVSGADIDAPQIQQYANAISWVANAVPTAAAYRWRGAARALRRLANTDEALAQIMAQPRSIMRTPGPRRVHSWKPPRPMPWP